MTRKKSQIVTLKAQGKGCSSHNLPKELSLITERIEKLSFVIKPLGKSKWKPKSASYSRMIDMVGFDDYRRSFSVNIYGEAYQQKFFIKVDFPKDKNLLESKCLEMGIPVKERQEDCYYYDQLKDFYKEEIKNTVEKIYKK
jgi:hypothetical protein